MLFCIVHNKSKSDIFLVVESFGSDVTSPDIFIIFFHLFRRKKVINLPDLSLYQLLIYEVSGNKNN